MAQRLLDALVSRTGMVLTGLLGCGLCIAAGLYFQAGANRLVSNHEAFSANHMRDSFVTMSDLSRLTLIGGEIAIAGELTPELRSRLLSALDILYVRADTIRHREHLDTTSGDLPAPSETIFDLVTYVDTALSEGIDDFITFELELIAHAERVRGRLVNFQDNMRRVEDQVLREQANEVNRQAAVMGSAFFLLGLLFFCAMVLLRKEVLARKARASAEQRARYLAFFDPLTGLPNRVQFYDKLAEWIEQERPLAILMIDLDRFKEINDTLGHAAGDAVLHGVAQSIALSATRQNGFAARLSGDEFALCLPTDNRDGLALAADTLLDRIAIPIDFEASKITVAASIGIATARQVARAMPVTASNLMRAGDFALYASKDSGKETFTIYNDSLEERFVERRDMIADLETAISEADLKVFLQPKVRLPEGVTYGFEALVRWQRAGKFVPPDVFVGLAEEAGLVNGIDYFVLNEATRLIARHNRRHGTSLSVSVNLSAIHFNNPQIVTEVQEALHSSGLPPALLTLEVTETVQIQDWDRVRLLLTQLKDLGCVISIDDFGTGYSSLAYLRNMVADELKVDRSLVDDITTSKEARYVLKAIFDLGTGFGMSIIVEGIETRDQSTAIQAIGCRHAQGYLFGKPLAAAEALANTIDARVRTA